MQTRVPLSSGLLSYIADYKGCTYELLDYYGFTAPKTRTFTFTPGDLSPEEVARVGELAVAAAEEIGYPVVTKPDAEAHGTGVTPNIRSPDELRLAVKWAMMEARRTAKIIVQSHVEGFDHRFLIIDYKGAIGDRARDPQFAPPSHLAAPPQCSPSRAACPHPSRETASFPFANLSRRRTPAPCEDRGTPPCSPA